MQACEPDASLMCGCCGRGFGQYDLAWCSICGLPFHLALRTDMPVNECGEAWLSDAVEAVIFSCNRCIGAQRDTPGQI
jgi:hypothetical protein